MMTTSSPLTDLRPEPLSIVIVDDDMDAAIGLKRVLDSLGHNCRVASCGEDALALLARSPADVVISDSRMPGIDGLALCRALRARDAAYVYFMLVTAIGDKQHLVEAMRTGVDDYITKPVDVDVLCARLLCAERVVRVHRALRARNRQLRRDSERNFKVARIDALTNARNRLALAEDLRALRAEARRYGHGCVVAMCDLDHFKDYNDALGHLAGDEALKRVVKTIEGQLRTGDGVYRFGGEEFVVLLPHQDLARGCAAMERVRRAVDHAGRKNPQGRELTISVGVAEIRGEDPDDEACLRRADAALYRAKLAGRNRVAL
jgi:two-component system cell cycle response regulator